jgi:hypothetical protein
VELRGCSEKTTFAERTRWDYPNKGYRPECNCGWSWDRLFNSSNLAHQVWLAHLYNQGLPDGLYEESYTGEERRKYVYEHRIAESAAERAAILREYNEMMATFVKD